MPRTSQPLEEARARRTSRRAAFALVVFGITLPLQWQHLAVTSFGILRWFDVGAVAMWIIARPTLRTLRWVCQDASTAWVSLLVLLFFRGFVGSFWGPSIGAAVQEGVYALFGLVSAAVLRDALAHPAGRRALAWICPASTASFLVFFSLKLQHLGVNAVQTLRTALVNHDSTALYQALFRVDAQNTTSADYQGAQIRHEIFAALLVCMYVSWLSLTVIRSATTRMVVAASSVVVLALLAVSGSRAVILATALGLAPFLVRIFTRRHLSLTGFFGVLVAVGASFFVLRELSGLLTNRVESTSSYDDRINAWHLSASDYLSRTLHGGPPLAASTHTVIGDGLLLGGLAGGVAGLVLVLAFTRRTVEALRRYLADGGSSMLAPVGCGVLILVRCFTNGGGYLHLVEWFAFALLIVTNSRDMRSPHRVPSATSGSLEKAASARTNRFAVAQVPLDRLPDEWRVAFGIGADEPPRPRPSPRSRRRSQV